MIQDRKGPPGADGSGLATGTVHGRLIKCAAAGSVQPTTGVPPTLVAVLGQSFTTLTDSDGNFQFNYIPPGDYTLGPAELFQFAPAGTASIHVVAGGTIDLNDIQTQNLSNDANNCGTCGTACAAGPCAAAAIARRRRATQDSPIVTATLRTAARRTY